METAEDPRYQAFIRNTVSAQTVYTLLDDEDYFAECPSAVYDEVYGEPVAVYCFWDSAADARACRMEEWAAYRLEPISLDEFMGELLIEFDQDAKLCGVAFDAELYGTEIEPIELLADLLDEIQQQNRQNDYPDFAELQRYCREWEAVMQPPKVIH